MIAPQMRLWQNQIFGGYLDFLDFRQKSFITWSEEGPNLGPPTEDLQVGPEPQIPAKVHPKQEQNGCQQQGNLTVDQSKKHLSSVSKIFIWKNHLFHFSHRSTSSRWSLWPPSSSTCRGSSTSSWWTIRPSTGPANSWKIRLTSGALIQNSSDALKKVQT